MIKDFVKAWDANKDKLKEYIATHEQSEYSDYKSLVSLIFEHVINPWQKAFYGVFDLDKIHEIDDGDY